MMAATGFSAATLLLIAAQAVVLQNFDDAAAGKPPAGFSLAAGRQASADRWMVRRDAASAVLVHLAEPAPPDAFAVAIHEGEPVAQADMSVRLRASAGSRTRGLVWRYQDPLNHYAAILNLEQQELAVYRVVRGNRIRLEREDDLELDRDAWHTLRVVQENDSFRVYLGGIRVFGDRDRTEGAPGAFGVWAAGDSEVAFDDLRAAPRLDRKR
jgi:hypothetical protein